MWGLGCGAPAGRTSRRPTETATASSESVPETRETAETRALPTLGDEILAPSESELASILPALSQDGRIAVILTESVSGSTVRRGVILRGPQQSHWVLADLDAAGESRVDPATSAANQADFLALFEGRAFRTLISTCAVGAPCALGTQRGLMELEETDEGTLVGRVEGREVLRWYLPEMELPRVCCARGNEVIPECFVRANRWEIWAAGSMILVKTAVESEAVACSTPPSYELLDVVW